MQFVKENHKNFIFVSFNFVFSWFYIVEINHKYYIWITSFYFVDHVLLIIYNIVRKIKYNSSRAIKGYLLGNLCIIGNFPLLLQTIKLEWL